MAKFWRRNSLCVKQSKRELFQVKMNDVHMDCKNASLFMD
jgi:hypothetical protein